MNKELPKVYEPQQVESRIYKMWEDNNCFSGDPDPKKKPFSIHAAAEKGFNAHFARISKW